jgi:uncharacterized integral membrane protein
MNDPMQTAVPPPAGMPIARKIKLGLWVLALILLLIFLLQNSAPVQLTYFVWSFSFSLALLIFIVFALGFLLGWALTALLKRRR